jgi:hypothetical protein
MKLKDVMPHEFMGCEYDDSQARRYADVEVVEQFDGRYAAWLGKEKNVFFWVKLANGKAVGFNENPARGWSFPVVRIGEPK